MMGFWDSIERLATIEQYLKLIVAIIGIPIALAAVFLWFVSSRLTTLRSIRDAASQQRLEQAEQKAVIAEQKASELDVALKQSNEEGEYKARIIGLASQMRQGHREALTNLRNYREPAFNERIRKFAQEQIIVISADYDRMFSEDYKKNRATPLSEFVPPNTEPVPMLIPIINNDPDLGQVCRAFLALRETTGIHFKMFDFQAVQEWCNKNPKKCQPIVRN